MLMTMLRYPAPHGAISPLGYVLDSCVHSMHWVWHLPASQTTVVVYKQLRTTSCLDGIMPVGAVPLHGTVAMAPKNMHETGT